VGCTPGRAPGVADQGFTHRIGAPGSAGRVLPAQKPWTKLVERLTPCFAFLSAPDKQDHIAAGAPGGPSAIPAARGVVQIGTMGCPAHPGFASATTLTAAQTGGDQDFSGGLPSAWMSGFYGCEQHPAIAVSWNDVSHLQGSTGAGCPSNEPAPQLIAHGFRSVVDCRYR